MVAVFVTAIATWIGVLIMEVVNLGGFLLEGTVAVIGGAIVGVITIWYRSRQRRQERRA